MKRIIRSKAIRLKCLDCSGGSPAEVKKCAILKCPLWRWRLGHEDKTADETLKDMELPPHLKKFAKNI